MPKRTPEGITMGFLGTGAMEVNAATDLIEEYVNENIQGEESVRFVFPLTTDEFTDTMGDLVNMAKASEIVYEVVRATTDKERRAFQEISASAAKTYDVPDVFTQMETMLVEAPRAILMVLWDSERDQELTEIASKFIDAGIDTRDLTDGLTRLGNDEDEAVAAAPEPEETGEEAEDAEEVPADAVEIFARSDLEKQSRDEIKAIAQSLGLPPRRSSATMIDEILAFQGEEMPQIVPEAPVSPQEPPAAVVVTETDVDWSAALAPFLAGLDEWAERLGHTFGEFLTRLDKVEIQVAMPRQSGGAPSTVPAAAEEAPAPRRLSRRG